MPLLPLDL